MAMGPAGCPLVAGGSPLAAAGETPAGQARRRRRYFGLTLFGGRPTMQGLH